MMHFWLCGKSLKIWSIVEACIKEVSVVYVSFLLLLFFLWQSTFIFISLYGRCCCVHQHTPLHVCVAPKRLSRSIVEPTVGSQGTAGSVCVRAAASDCSAVGGNNNRLITQQQPGHGSGWDWALFPYFWRKSVRSERHTNNDGIVFDDLRMVGDFHDKLSVAVLPKSVTSTGHDVSSIIYPLYRHNGRDQRYGNLFYFL